MSASPGVDRSIRITKPDGRPEIRVGVDIARMTDAAIGALAHDGATYQRAGKIVAVVTVPDGPMRLVRGVKRMAGTQTIIPLISGSLRERCSSAAHWVKFDGRREAFTETTPPENVISAILARGEWGGIRPLVSVATCPQLRPDGSILQRHGYDEETGILYWPSDAFPDVAENPGLDDARGALEAIREVVCDFPFARPEHESAWIAGLLTMLARPAIDGPVPMFAVDATTRGTGKSRLVDAASTIALGHHCARTSMPEDDDEMRKRITLLVLDGDPSVCLDNIVAPLAMPSLDAVLTSMTWKDRLLGKNANVTAPHRIVWWATGNNLVMGGDISRRALHIRLESSLENPEERSGFAHPNLLQWVAGERRRLVVSGLTLMRAYMLAVAAGTARYEGGLWGSFEEWSRIICGALAWAGAADPLLARATQDPALDDEKRALKVLIEGLNRLCPVQYPGAPVSPLPARAIIAALYPDHDPHDGPLAPDGYDDFRDVIEQETRCLPGKKPEARRLGKWLQRVRGRVVGGWCVQRHEGAGHSACWRAEPSGESQPGMADSHK